MEEHEAWQAKQSPELRALIVEGETIFYDPETDFDQAIIGIAPAMPTGELTVSVIAYDMDMVQLKLEKGFLDDLTKDWEKEHPDIDDVDKDDRMVEAETMAAEHISHNISGGWIGDYTPLHVYPLSEDSKEQLGFMADVFVGIGSRCGQPDVAVYTNAEHMRPLNLEAGEPPLNPVLLFVSQ